MTAPLYIIDLHNTLYDEVREYAGAIRATIDAAIGLLKAHALPLPSLPELQQEMAAAHAQLGSDWHEQVWAHMPCLAGLPPQSFLDLQKIRIQESERLTQKHAYSASIKAMRQWRAKGAILYLLTEASAHAAASALRWLDLDDGTFSGLVCWPYNAPFIKPRTPMLMLPPSLQKPHPQLVALIWQMEMQRRNFSADVSWQDMFALEQDANVQLTALEDFLEKLPMTGCEQKAQRSRALEALRLKLEIKPDATPIAHALQKKTIMIGDSLFKDGWLARAAGIPFVQAAYGKNHAAEDLAYLYATTGWDKSLLQLTQEAASLPQLQAEIKPSFIAPQGLQEHGLQDWLQQNSMDK